MGSIVVLLGSPRKGNSEALANVMADEAKKNGHDIKTFKINKMDNAHGCQACYGCKKSGRCVFNDDITEVLDAVRDADGLIVALPMYFAQPSAQYRMFEDRLFGFMNQDFSLNMASGKKFAAIVSCGSGHEAGLDLANQIEKTMTGALKFNSLGTLVMTGGFAPNVASQNVEMIDKAKRIGSKF